MSSGKKRNLLNLSLPPTVSEEGGTRDGEQRSAEPIDDQLSRMALSQPQVQRMHEWMDRKKQVYPEVMIEIAAAIKWSNDCPIISVSYGPCRLASSAKTRWRRYVNWAMAMEELFTRLGEQILL